MIIPSQEYQTTILFCQTATSNLPIQKRTTKESLPVFKGWLGINKMRPPIFQEAYPATHIENSVDENWKAIRSHIDNLMNAHMPSRTSNTRVDLSWLSRPLKRMCSKKQCLYNKPRQRKMEIGMPSRPFKRPLPEH